MKNKKVFVTFFLLFILTYMTLWFTIDIDETIKEVPNGLGMVFFRANKFEAISYLSVGISCIYVFIYTLVKYGVKIKNKQFKKIDILKILGIFVVLVFIGMICFVGYTLSSHTVYK